jgi:predicted DNA-binding antitoxin AbrB/MazE fold protein
LEIRKVFLSVKTKLIMVISMGIRVKARYEDKVLKPLEELELKEGEEVEIEVKEKRVLGGKGEILRYAGLLKDMNEEEEKIFEEAVKRRSLFGRVLNL